MKVVKNEYKVIKDKGFVGQKYSTYTIEKKIIYDNGETEIRHKVFIPARDGKIKEVDFDKLDFPKPITHEEWLKLPIEYRKKWLQI